jgi:methylmalonyl-CoA mutase N-terminal domain/subunit
MKERFNATNERAMKLKFHTQTAGSTLTAQQPMNNIVRVTLQALAAVMGGTQSLHTNSYDEALGLPTEESATIALRTQQIIAYESGATDTIDPFAGSYAVESLTNEIEKKAWEYIEKIDEIGGMVKAIENGYVQKEILNTAYDTQLKIENKKDVIVGVNEFSTEEEEPREVLKLDPTVEERQKNKLKKLREERDNEKVENALKALKEAANSDENLMEYIIEAVQVYATLGEITNVLRDVYGEFNESVIL